MLCQFSFENFRSYQTESILDMQAARIEEYSDTLIPSPCPNFSSLLPIAAIFGPNSGGKSNAIAALAYLISSILLPINASIGIKNHYTMSFTGYSPFLFDDKSKTSPTNFQIFFRTKTAQYQYYLSTTSTAIVEESLYAVKIPCQRRCPVMLFERKDGEIVLGAPLKKANTQQISLSIPYLSFLFINYSFPQIQDAVQWFLNCCVNNYAASGKDHRLSSMINSPKVKDLILNMLEGMDIPIIDYEVQMETSNNGEKIRRVLTTHKIGEKPYQLDLADESEGTLKIFSILPAIIFSLEHGSPLIVDELDAKLHPQLLRYLIELFSNSNFNHKHAQLIFTCHDLSIMRNDVLRRDEIWFAAHNENGSSELWSLYDLRDENDERVKNTAAYDRQYLAGRYGADPYLKQILDWRDCDG